MRPLQPAYGHIQKSLARVQRLSIILHDHYLHRRTSPSKNTDFSSQTVRRGLATSFPNSPRRVIGGRLRCVKVLGKRNVVAGTAGDVQMPIPST